jgi:hypothetical protein
VAVVEHQAPIGIVSQPPGAADAPIRRSLRGDAVLWNVVQRHVGAVRLLERDVAVEAVVPAPSAPNCARSSWCFGRKGARAALTMPLIFRFLYLAQRLYR